MKLNKTTLSVILLSVVATVLIYPSLPKIIPQHWNFEGMADRFGSKDGVWVTALLPLGIYLLLTFLPRFDPHQAAFLKHQKAYQVTSLAVTLFLIVLHWVTILVAMGQELNVGLITRGLIGLLFILLGNYLSQIRPNYCFGIRTPWTLADETVWRKTHRSGGYGFVAAGLLTLVSVAFKGWVAFILVIGSLGGVVIFTTVYSYLAYRKTKC